MMGAGLAEVDDNSFFKTTEPQENNETRSHPSFDTITSLTANWAGVDIIESFPFSEWRREISSMSRGTPRPAATVV